MSTLSTVAPMYRHWEELMLTINDSIDIYEIDDGLGCKVRMYKVTEKFQCHFSLLRHGRICPSQSLHVFSYSHIFFILFAALHSWTTKRHVSQLVTRKTFHSVHVENYRLAVISHPEVVINDCLISSAAKPFGVGFRDNFYTMPSVFRPHAQPRLGSDWFFLCFHEPRFCRKSRFHTIA